MCHWGYNHVPSQLGFCLGAKDLTQHFMFARQVLYQLSRFLTLMTVSNADIICAHMVNVGYVDPCCRQLSELTVALGPRRYLT